MIGRLNRAFVAGIAALCVWTIARPIPADETASPTVLLSAGSPEEAAEKRFDSPEAAHEAKDYDAAIRLFDQEIAANPGDADKLCGRGLALLQIAEYDKALADFEAVLKLAPDDALAHYGRGRVRRMRRQPREAMRDLTRAIELAPSSDAAFLAYCERARLFIELLELELARADAEKALAMRPTRPEAHLARGYVCVAEFRRKRLPKERAWDDPKGLLNHFNSARRIDGKCIDVRLGMVEACYSTGFKYDQLLGRALNSIDAAIRIHGEDRKDPMAGVLRAHRAWVNAIFQGEDESIREDAETAVTLATREPFVHLVRASVLEVLGETERAIDVATQYIDMAGPIDPSGYYLRAGLFFELERFADAIADFTLALARPLRDWERADLYLNRGIAFNAMNENRSALADLNRAIELDPADAQYYLIRGFVHGFLGDHEKEGADYKESVRLDPSLEDGRVWRGAFYFREGDFEAARADYEWAIERSPLNGLLYFESAHLYELLGRKDEAESDRKKGRELIADIDPEPHERKLAEIQAWLQENPSNPSLYWYRGECYQVLGREDEANADRRRAMDLHAEARRQKKPERGTESCAEEEDAKPHGDDVP